MILKEIPEFFYQFSENLDLNQLIELTVKNKLKNFKELHNNL